jgi:hypothetical protein
MSKSTNSIEVDSEDIFFAQVAKLKAYWGDKAREMEANKQNANRERNFEAAFKQLIHVFSNEQAHAEVTTAQIIKE